MNLNKVFVLGNVTRDPQTRNLPSGQPVTSFGVATNRFFTSQNGEKRQEVEFHNIVTFGKLSDIASQYIKKGSLVLIEGRLRTGSWENPPGNKHFRTEIIAERLQLGPKTNQNMPTESGREEIKNKVKEEDIPVIEEGSEGLGENQNDVKENEHITDKPKETEQEEIDVNKIPF
ncbi:single-stranded DNA-binding protein [bacterium]|nr:single-stranded DNA-binding protein [bacterium]